MDAKKLFNLIADFKVRYFVTDYCREEQEKPIKEHVERQIVERLKNASDKQKNTNFIIALIYDQGSNDSYTQGKRIQFQRADLLSEFDVSYYKIKPFKCNDQDKKLKDITKFIKNIKSIEKYIKQNDIVIIKQSINDIYGVGTKLTDWSITNVTGKEYVIDTHIARVLYRLNRLSKVSKDEYKRYKNPSYYEVVSNKFKEISRGYFNDFGDYKGFAATQYLWFLENIFARIITRYVVIAR